MNPKHDRLAVILEPPFAQIISIDPLKDIMKPPKHVVLEKHVFRDDLGQVIYTCWTPPEGEYTDREIEVMRKACEKAKIRFQLRIPKEAKARESRS